MKTGSSDPQPPKDSGIYQAFLKNESALKRFLRRFLYEIAAQQKVRLFFDAIADLPPQCRRVFLMRKVQGMPHKAICDALNISASAVEKHIAIGTDRCKRYIQNHEGVNNSDQATVTELPQPKPMARGQSHD